MSSLEKVEFDDHDLHEQRAKTRATDEDILSSISNEMKWAIHEFISRYRSQHEVTILDFEFEKERMDAARGSFTAGVLRLNLSLSSHRRSSVVFKIPQLSSAYRFVRKTLFYDKERYMYAKILPRIQPLWPKDEKPPFAHFYTATDSGVLVMENLEETGFRTRDINCLLDFADAKVVLKSLARFHATSIAVLDDESFGAELDALTVTDILDNEVAADFISKLSLAFQKHISPQVGEDVRKMYEDVFTNYRSMGKLGNSPNTNGLNVILHGDAHIKNILLQRDECKLIDFQCTRRGSPAIDLVFFLVSSVKFEVLGKNHAALLEYYLQEFNSTIGRNDCKYNMDKLNADFKQYREYFVYILCFTASIWINEWKVGGKDMQETDLDRVIKSERYRSTFAYWIGNLMKSEECFL